MRRIVRSLPLLVALVAITFPLFSAPAFGADPVNGAAVYTKVCSGCHGTPGGGGNFPPVLKGANSAKNINFYLNTEPAMEEIVISASDVDDIAAYLGTFVAPVTTINPQAGYWWNPAEGGRGFTIEQNATSGNVFFATYLYTAGGSSLWYAAGPAAMNGAVFTGPLLAYANGQTLTGAYQPAAQVSTPGNVTITFSDASHASLTWPGGTIPIQRYEFVTGGLNLPPTGIQPQTGYWWNPAEGGRGYTIEVQGGTAFIAAYMYDPQGNPIWYAAGPATLTGGNTYVGSWTTYMGGETLTGSYQSPTGTVPAGNLTIQFTSATAATLTLPDGRQIPIQRYSF
jgi:cytochrome c553